jgi:5-methylcytosine-specific restriction endonuclease McrA
MGRYEGDPKMPMRVKERDKFRCRWCGATNQGIHVHHIRYRRGPADDVEDNLISLCPACHSTVHGLNRKFPIRKHVAQEILFELITKPGCTGLSLMRRKERARER